MKHLDYHKLTAADAYDCQYSEVTPRQRQMAKRFNFTAMYTPGVRFMVDPRAIERRMSREEIVEILEGRYSIQCYDHESKLELAEALAEAATTEGDSL